MTRSFPLLRRISKILPLIACAAPHIVQADTGAWKNTAGGLWSSSDNWIQNTVADGTDATAFFSNLNITADTTISLDTPRSIGNLDFSDIVPSNNWHLTDNANSSNVLTLATTAHSSTISVNNRTAFIDLVLAGNSDLVKEAFGTLVITKSAAYTGNTSVFAGALISGTANALPTSTSLFVDGDTTFDLNGNAQQVSGLAGGGTVTNSIATPATFTVSSNTTTTAQTLLTGNLSFTFTGGGKLTLLTTATYTGNTTIDNSTLVSGVTNVIPTTNALTLQNNATLDLNGQNQTVTFLAGSTSTVTNTAANTTAALTIDNTGSDPVLNLITGNINLTKQGTGPLFLNRVPSYTGLTTINDGNFLINVNNVSLARIVGNGILVINPQHSLTSDAILLPDVTILGSASITIRPNGSSTSVINELILSGSTNDWKSKIDLTNNKLIIQPTTDRATALDDAKNQVLFGKTRANGIVSSTLASNQSVAAVDNALAGFTTFAGQPVDANSILILTTFTGDANLDGQVTIADLNTVASHWQQFVSDWSQGDFNGDGQVTIADLNFIAANWQAGVGAGASTQTFSEALASIPTFSSTSHVPEPTSLALLALAALPLIRRRALKSS